MRTKTEYVVYVGAMEWGSKSTLEEAMKLYKDAKEHSSDCFVSLSKVTIETLISEFIEIEDDE